MNIALPRGRGENLARVDQTKASLKLSQTPKPEAARPHPRLGMDLGGLPRVHLLPAAHHIAPGSLHSMLEAFSGRHPISGLFSILGSPLQFRPHLHSSTQDPFRVFSQGLQPWNRLPRLKGCLDPRLHNPLNPASLMPEKLVFTDDTKDKIWTL